MNDILGAGTVDMVRWTFRADLDRFAEIEAHLKDLGLDVYVQEDGRFTVICEEPEGGLDERVEDLWRINGGPFEVTHEEFHRLKHLVYEVEGEGLKGVARSVA